MNHREAYCLMWYACAGRREDGCGHVERIWNSRNGVTPFVISCPSCTQGLQHVDFALDVKSENHVLRPFQRFFRNGTEEEASKIVMARIKRIKSMHEISAERMQTLFEDIMNGGEFQDGWPILDINIPKYLKPLNDLERKCTDAARELCCTDAECYNESCGIECTAYEAVERIRKG